LRGLREYVSRVEHPPDVVVWSSALRTVDTLDCLRAALPKRASIDVSDELYLANADTLLTRLHGLDGKVRCAMLVGNNPGIEDLALLLVGSGDAELRAQLTAKLPTGAVVALSVDGRWNQLGADAARARRPVHATPAATVTSPRSSVIDDHRPSWQTSARWKSSAQSPSRGSRRASRRTTAAQTSW
jgi:phosphohistidine phosphatase SixA